MASITPYCMDLNVHIRAHTRAVRSFHAAHVAGELDDPDVLYRDALLPELTGRENVYLNGAILSRGQQRMIPDSQRLGTDGWLLLSLAVSDQEMVLLFVGPKKKMSGS